MSKYIIEIKPEYEDSFKGLMILGAKDSNLFVDTLAVENLEELNSDYINEHYGSLQDEAYQRGLDDAWDAAKKLSWVEKYGGYGDRLDKVFDRTDIFDFLDYSPNEAIDKLKAYEEKQKADDEIKVGDEVITPDGTHFVVFEVGGYFGDDAVGTFILFGENNSSVDIKAGCFSHSMTLIAKTGRHFDIDKILAEMRT